MLMRNSFLISGLVALGLSACSSGGSGDGPTHWNKQPLESMAGTSGGLGFTIQVPKGMERGSDDSFFELDYHAKVRGEGYTFAPRLMVTVQPIKSTLAGAMKEDSDIKSPSDVVFKEETPTGWVYAIPDGKDKDNFVIKGETFVGDKALSCHARLYPMSPTDGAKDDLPLVVKMCQSITPS